MVINNDIKNLKNEFLTDINNQNNSYNQNQNYQNNKNNLYYQDLNYYNYPNAYNLIHKDKYH